MNLLALDLGTITGFAILHNGSTYSGVCNFKQTHSSKGRRFLLFRNWLIDIFKKYDIERVFYEDVKRHLGTAAAHCYGGFLYHMVAVCEEFCVPYEGFPVGSIKKTASGKGNATKEDMMKAALNNGFKPKDHNEADALAILLMAIRKNQRNAGLEKYSNINGKNACR